jgi:hypothetical protein
MTNRALAMPDYVAQLIRLPRMGLEPSEATDDIVTCPLLYEDGTVLSLVVMCIAKRGWFNREKPALAISIVALSEATRAARVYLSETVAVPTDDSDLPFMLRFVAMVKAMIWTHAATGNMGECKSFPKGKAS